MDRSQHCLISVMYGGLWRPDAPLISQKKEKLE